MALVSLIGWNLLIVSAIYLGICIPVTNSQVGPVTDLQIYNINPVFEGMLVHLTCECQSFPPANISWYKSGQEDRILWADTIEEYGVTKSKLRMVFHSSDNGSQFVCSAFNSEFPQKQTENIIINVASSPKMAMSAVLEADEDRLSGRVTCQIESNSDDYDVVKIMYDSDERQVMNHSIGIVDKTTRTYTAQFRNKFEPVSQEILCIAPGFRRLEKSIFIEGTESFEMTHLAPLRTANHTLSADCRVNGRQVAHRYEWVRILFWCRYDFYFDGPVLEISDFSQAGGRYYCKGYNEANQLESVAFFELEFVDQQLHCPHMINPGTLHRPEVQVPDTFEANLATNVSVMCHAFAYPPAQVRWTKEDGVLVSDGPILRLNNITHESVGVYTCEASNVDKRSGRIYNSSASMSLHVPRAPGKLSISPWPAIILTGENVTLTCTANPTGWPLPQYEWVISLKSTDTVISRQSQLDITNASQADANTYICRAFNNVAKSNATKVFLRVVDQSSISWDPQQPVTQLYVGDKDFKLFCSFSDTEISPVIWLKNGKRINSDDMYLIETQRSTQTTVTVNSTLYFSGANRTDRTTIVAEDGGIYACIMKSVIRERTYIEQIRVSKERPPATPEAMVSSSNSVAIIVPIVVVALVAAIVGVLVYRKRRQAPKFVDNFQLMEDELAVKEDPDPMDDLGYEDFLDLDNKLRFS